MNLAKFQGQSEKVKKIDIRNIQRKLSLRFSELRIIKKAIRDVFESERIKKHVGIAVCIVDDKAIRKINKKYLAQDCPTDVIAFNLSRPNAVIIGDIVVSADTAISNGKRFHTTPFSELVLYCIHGALHILGYDDKTKGERKLIDIKSLQILERLKNPNANQ